LRKVTGKLRNRRRLSGPIASAGHLTVRTTT
jgi:hypothetical protein